MERCPFKNSSSNRPLKLSMRPFCYCLPSVTPANTGLVRPAEIAFELNSIPWSLTIVVGM
jgi:hypothetical protein